MIRSLRERIPFVLSIGIVLLGACADMVHAQNRVTIEQIRTAWEKRSKQIRSAHFAWTSKRTDSVGAMTDYYYPVFQEKGVKTIPPKETTLIEDSTLTLVDTGFRYYLGGHQWSRKTESYELRPYLSVQAGDTSKSLMTSTGNYARGMVNLPKNSDGTVPNLRAIFTCIRGLTPGCKTYSLDELSVFRQHVAINGKDCIELQSNASKNGKDYLYIDSAHNFTVVRCVESDAQRVHFSMDINYVKDPCGEWVPAEWSYVTVYPSMYSKDLTKRFVAKVTSHEINPVIDNKELNIDYPSESLVTDTKGGGSYIVQEDGSKSVVSRNDLFKKSPEELRVSARQTAFQSRWYFWVSMSFLIAGLCAGGIFAWRWLAKRTSAR